LLTIEEIKNTLQPIPYIKEALNKLTYPRCVASGSEPDKIQLSLEVTGLRKYFTHIYSSVQVPRGKPFPDVFLHAAREMNFSTHQCIVIEDSDPGVQASLAAGMKVLLYRPVLSGNSILHTDVTVFTDMAFLPELIKRTIQSGK
jgi:HAD superfamily hydrolase (TIGR01509 family)